MERLTINISDRLARCNKVSTDYCLSHRSCFDCAQYSRIVDRLAAYEDIGLEPVKINILYHRYHKLVDGVTFDRLRELAKADMDGRCVMLPCKVGDTVYVVFTNGIKPYTVDRIHILAGNKIQVRMRFHVNETLWLSADNFGKTVFLTREEAEAALEAQKAQLSEEGGVSNGETDKQDAWAIR